ncbi:MAG: metallophosphoesterase, partial [Thermodesulfobacteriota bacterium]
REKPDILVMTGDFTDLYTRWTPARAALFREIRPRLGAFAVTGNHEAYFDQGRALSFIADAGFRLLQGTSCVIRDGGRDVMAVAGVDDPAMGLTQNERAVLTKARSGGLFTLFLKHQPVAAKATRGLFDLQLSGHSHGGQIFPFHLLAAIPYTKLSGRADFSQGSTLYVSRGSGYWGPPIRIFAPREITVIDLVRRGAEGPDKGGGQNP